MSYFQYFFSILFPLSFTSFCHAPESVLFVGDSLSSGSAFSEVLVENFSNWKNVCTTTSVQETHISSYALPSSSPRHYIATSGDNKYWLCKQKKIYRNGTAPDTSGAQLCQNTSGISVFQKMIGEHKPAAYIIVLGTNSFAFSADYLKARVHEMLEEMEESSRCFWVTPTYVSTKYEQKAKDTTKAILEALTSHPKSCVAIESFEEMKKQVQCTHFLVSDGVHHTRCGSELWGEFVTRKICESWSK